MRYSRTLLQQTTIMASSALSNVKKTLTVPFVGAFQVGNLLRGSSTENYKNVNKLYYNKNLDTKKCQQIQMLADPLLTEHYAKAGLGAVLIDQQHGLSREFVIWLK